MCDKRKKAKVLDDEYILVIVQPLEQFMLKSGFWDSKASCEGDEVVQHIVPEGSSRGELGLELGLELVTGSTWNNWM